MEDNQIVQLYLERSEDALMETQKKYGRYANYIAYNILSNNEDAKECVNSAYYSVWNSIPPKEPENLGTYLGKIVRNLALDMYDKFNAKKRGKGRIELALNELSECLPTTQNVEKEIEGMVLKDILNSFLEGLSKEARVIFVRRYWYLSSIKEIATEYQISESKVKMSLMRTRNRLKEYLREEGYYEK